MIWKTLKETVEAQFEVYTRNVSWETEKNLESLHQNSKWLGHVLNPGPSENSCSLLCLDVMLFNIQDRPKKVIFAISFRIFVEY
jgi:hypothetical protein